MDEAPLETPKWPWFEPSCAILMAVASVATAWCSYQSSCWSGESGGLEAHADKLQRQAIAQHHEARQIEAIQMRLVMEVIDARMEGNEKLASYYADRFTDELKPAYEKWIALNPLEDRTAPPHPFVPGFYTPRFEQEIRDAQAGAVKAEAEAGVAGHVASSYLGNTVSLATVILFAATAEKFNQPRVRGWSLAFAICLFLFAAVRTALLPII
ncbi:hypothetical protein OKA05_17975 [Luteolibacter arcticus]|uniref:DUF4337 domain-containing protein n=1 Tax=Luteolibacter arcticus TaxID=1581411 RepID=A0ABT3GLQ3_9BACT|nr:hypothetical protein [Luteolibacter arcticus]MCW1924460.1 hypothetical protein [Luteolibacter arcticus]